MSKPENSHSQSDSSEGDDPPPPPPPLPNPDISDPSRTGASYGPSGGLNDGEKKKRKKKGKQSMASSHPTDVHHSSSPKKKGCRGCCGCLGGGAVVVLLIFVALLGVVFYYGPGRHVLNEYEIATLEEADATIETAPETATYYIAPSKVRYEAPQTDVPVAIFAAGEIEITGNFEEDVSLTTAKVTGEPGAHFSKDLEVYAMEFVDEGITLLGELKGRVMQNLP